MKKLVSLLAVLFTAGLFVLSSAPAQAQASRTWVSGVGDDANPCSRTAPCKTFAGSIAKTAIGGEIDCLDPGGFGAVTITKAITIECLGTFGSVLVSGTNGIVVQAGANDVVTLRGLSINGIGTGINGIRFLSGKALIVDRVDIFGFTTNGVDISLGATSAVFIKDLAVTNVGGTGVAATTSTGFVTVEVDRSHFNQMTTGISAGNLAFTNVTNSIFAGNLTTGVTASNNGHMDVDNCKFTNVATGASVTAAGAQVRVSNNSFYDNTNAFVITAGTLSSAGNNQIVGPTANPNGTAYTLK